MRGLLRSAGLLLVVALVTASGCRCVRKEAGESEQSRRGAGPSPPRQAASSGLRLVLGRVADLSTFQAGKPLTPGAPDIELTDPESDFAVALLYDERIQGFRLSTGAPLWTVTPYAPCRSLAIGGPNVYAVCGEKLISYAKADGSATEVKKEHTTKAVIAGPLVATLDGENGHVTLFETTRNQLVASKNLPEIARPWLEGVVAAPSTDGVCAYGMHVNPSVPHGWECKVGCYDRSLAPRWTKTISFPFPPGTSDIHFAVSDLLRQTGPHHLVLDHCPDGEAPKKGRGQGALVRWRDGEITLFDDHAFATVEDTRGERITAPAVKEILSGSLPADPAISRGLREAQVVTDGDRAFILIVHLSYRALAAVDRATGARIFLVPIPLGETGGKLELAGRLPIVRTDLGGSWRATVHDPATGSVLYKDERRYR